MLPLASTDAVDGIHVLCLAAVNVRPPIITVLQLIINLIITFLPRTRDVRGVVRMPTVKGNSHMRAVFLSIIAAVTLAGPADARTVGLTDFFAAGNGSMSVEGARIELTTPAPVETLSRAEMRDAALLRCTGPRDQFCFGASRPSRLEEASLTIFIEEGFSLSKLSFGDLISESAFARRNPAVIVNGISFTLEELSSLTLTSGRVVINLNSLAAAGLSLRSFEITDLSTPLPAAGILMLAGLGGLAAARSVRKKV